MKGDVKDRAIKRKIRQRDSQKCKMCGKSYGSGRKLDIHHKNENKKEDGSGNLITLCRECHCKLHAIEKNKKYHKK